MQFRPLRTRALVTTLALSCLSPLAACSQDPGAHATFTAVTPTPMDAAMTTPPPDSGAPSVEAGPPADGGTSGCGMLPDTFGTYSEYHISIAGPDVDANKQLQGA